MSGFMERFQNEILFSTRFSTTFSTIFSTIFRKYKKNTVLVSSWTTIDHAISFTQVTLLSSFVSKRKFVLSIAEAFRNIHFLPQLFTMDEVCNITNKYQPPGNLAKYQYFYARDFISLTHSKKVGSLDCKRFSKYPLFITIFNNARGL